MLYDPKRHLSSAELSETLERLSKADWIRLNRIATSFAHICGVSKEDLLQEAIIRALDGKRLCPCDVNVVRFLGETMRSIASSDAKAHKRHPEISLQTPKQENGSDYLIDLKDSKQPTIEDSVIAKIDLAKAKEIVPKLFESDPEKVQLLVMGVLDEMDTEELQEFSGLQGTEYSSARKLFRRRIEKAFPGGLSND